MKTLVLMATFVLGCGGRSLSTDGGAGASGSAGSAGNAGATGTAGATGGAGSTGNAGATGTGGAGSAGNAGATGTAGASGSGGHVGGTGSGGTAGSPPHRPTAIACAPNNIFPGFQDAGVTSCATDSDCRPDGGMVFAAYCHNDVCTGDRCFADSDCGVGNACSCAYPFGHGLAANVCVRTGCLVDGDCASGLCSPAFGGLCVSSQGYRCRSAADTCHADSDCPSQTDGGITLPRGCQFVPEAGHWQCAAVSLCVG